MNRFCDQALHDVPQNRAEAPDVLDLLCILSRPMAPLRQLTGAISKQRDVCHDKLHVFTRPAWQYPQFVDQFPARWQCEQFDCGIHALEYRYRTAFVWLHLQAPSRSIESRSGFTQSLKIDDQRREQPPQFAEFRRYDWPDRQRFSTFTVGAPPAKLFQFQWSL